jgi:hypothetical protein
MDSAEAQSLVWHKMCYAHITDRINIARLHKTRAAKVDSKQEFKPAAAAALDVNRAHCEDLCNLSTGAMHFLPKVGVGSSSNLGDDETNVRSGN